MRFPAAVWIFVIGCGDGVMPPVVGPPPPARGDVSVRVTDDTDVGIPGCPVYFQTIDSLVEAAAFTGSDGMATAHVTDGGFVTIVDGANTTTFAGVMGGDVLAVPHPTTLPTVELDYVGAFPDGIDHVWTTCGFLYFGTGTAVGVARCDSNADVLFETVGSIQAMFQTVALVDGGTIDMTVPLVDEMTESLSILHAPPDVAAQQWLITSHGRLKFEYVQAPSLVLHQPSIPGATFKTIVRAEGILVIDPTPEVAAYQLDLADVVPSAVGPFTTDVSDLRWLDDGSRPANFAVGQGEGWTLIAPIEYRDTDAVLHVPTLPGRNDTPKVQFLTTFTDGESYDAARAHAAEYWLGFLSETDGSGSRLSGKSTPSRRVVAQFIDNCEVVQQPCE